ncbi:MAG TPA: hypothetical protein P5571_13705 [Candidatus Krumholzibacteria bacterium]|nr:hypothetical protein [Candidatus Krumholzibacteria bacterium]HRX52420.1 hypothetical protein [Candidatus Krumholzibacteria bacterium]
MNTQRSTVSPTQHTPVSVHASPTNEAQLIRQLQQAVHQVCVQTQRLVEQLEGLADDLDKGEHHGR